MKAAVRVGVVGVGVKEENNANAAEQVQEWVKTAAQIYTTATLSWMLLGKKRLFNTQQAHAAQLKNSVWLF